MELVCKNEMKKVTAGATYTVTCPYCGDSFSVDYAPLLVSKATAKIAAQRLLDMHIEEAHLANL